MTYIVGVVSQKGGSGKSTIARLFARELSKDGFRVKIADLDTQQTTSTLWAADRSENGIEPDIQVQPFGNVRLALAESKLFDAYILDGRPHASQQTIEIAKASTLTIIPTGQTKDDLRPAVTLAHALANAGVYVRRIAFALIKTTSSDVEVAAARAYLDQTDYKVLEGYVPVSTAYGVAHDSGKALTETSFKSLNQKAERLAQSIIDYLVDLKELS